jgi:serine/threonine-protein kinase
MRPPGQELGGPSPAGVPVTSVESLLALLRTSPLLDGGQLAELAAIQGNYGEARDLARELLKRNWLTAFQVNQLFRGKGDELVLGSYVLLEKLGEGGMGAVYKARNWKLNKLVALKLIRRQRLEDPSALRRFQREIRAAAHLDHPNIVRAFDADEVNGTHFLVMEYVEGADLARLVQKHGPLPVELACDFVRQAALGLQHAFERGLVHRDVKPANLLLVPADLSRTGTIKILDMGLARVGPGEGAEELSSAVTQEGTVMGTPDYIAPEQALESHTVDVRADLYSLGCTFYFLLTGRVPFPGGNFLKKINRHQFEVPPAVEGLRPAVPPALAGVVRKLMAKRPEDRFQTPAELVAALAYLPVAAAPTAVLVPQQPHPQAAEATFANLRDDASTATPSSKASQGLPGPRWRLLAAVAGGVLVVGTLIGVGWLLSRKKEGPRSAAVQPTPPRPQPKKQAGEFFNGTDLTGWEGLDGYWKVENGELVGTTTGALKHGTFLCSQKTYRDFELSFRVKLSPGGNSGVQVRSELFDRTNFRVKGPQADMGIGYWGSLYGEALAGMMKAAPAEAQAAIKEGDWNDYSIKVVGKHITIEVNGRVTVDGDFPGVAEEGIIAWQLHQAKAMWVRFKDVVFTELSTTRPGEVALFNGKDLTGWKLQGAPGASAWVVEKGELVNSRTSLNLYSEREFGDCRIELECNVPPRGNSGIYLMGEYEVQIFDSFGKAPSPVEMGAVYGKVAPRVNASRPANEWQTFVIEFQAPRFKGDVKVANARVRKAWLNDQLIHDDVEINGPCPQGLTGKERATGPLMFQGTHGAIRFRNIRVTPR